jgi:hypothetical protein
VLPALRVRRRSRVLVDSSNGSRVRDVAEQHRDMPALPESLDPRWDCRRPRCNARDRLRYYGRPRAWCVGDRRRRPHCCDRSQELAATLYWLIVTHSRLSGWQKFPFSGTRPRVLLSLTGRCSLDAKRAKCASG